MKVEQRFYVYMMVSSSRRALDTELTNNFVKRVWQHKNDVSDGFTKQYQTHNLVYFEIFQDIRNAIDREKQIKGWKRARKDALVETTNLTWKDLGASEDQTRGPSLRSG